MEKKNQELKFTIEFIKHRVEELNKRNHEIDLEYLKIYEENKQFITPEMKERVKIVKRDIKEIREHLLANLDKLEKMSEAGF